MINLSYFNNMAPDGLRNTYMDELIPHFKLDEVKVSIYMIDTYIRNRKIVSEEEKIKIFL
jgi:hypothetical protein